jgi:N-acetylglucosamine kinase-like BadF-type ATPase
MKDELVIGVDAGGTTSRAVLATTDGEILGRATAGPGNPMAEGPRAANGIGAAIEAALSGRDPSAVVAATLGMAGTSVASNPVIVDAFAAMWAHAGLTCPMTVVGDVITAFSAGTPAADGVVLIAGTGAIAAEIRGLAITRTVDGHGWLLGDEGGGRWLGLQALRAVIRDWSLPFAHRIAGHVGVETADQLVQWAQALPLTAIGDLAPLVCASARSGDPTAERIVTDAVGSLLRSLDALAAPGPTVLAGSLLVGDTPVRDGVVAALAPRGITIGTAHDPAAAAAWHAARPYSGLAPSRLHKALLGL